MGNVAKESAPPSTGQRIDKAIDKMGTAKVGQAMGRLDERREFDTELTEAENERIRADAKAEFKGTAADSLGLTARRRRQP